jgi:hypothetical protein
MGLFQKDKSIFDFGPIYKGYIPLCHTIKMIKINRFDSTIRIKIIKLMVGTNLAISNAPGAHQFLSASFFAASECERMVFFACIGAAGGAKRRVEHLVSGRQKLLSRASELSNAFRPQPFPLSLPLRQRRKRYRRAKRFLFI